MEQKSQSTTNDTVGWLFGAILIGVGAVALANQIFDFNLGAVFVSLLFGAVSAAFFLVALRSPSNWWAMIPGYIAAFVGSIILLSRLGLGGELMGVFITSAIGFPFLYVFLRDRRQWWALIPAYAMFAVSGIIGLSTVLHGSSLIATYVMLAIALPFYVVYFRNRMNWWALIPAGIMTLIGLGIFMASFQYILPIILIAVGIAILAMQFGRKNADAPALPRTGPGADKPTSV